MGCCGRARAQIGTARAASRPAAAVAGVDRTTLLDVRSLGSTVTLRYLGPASVTVRGPATGRAYAFSAGVPTPAVDPRDAAVLLTTAYFRQG